MINDVKIKNGDRLLVAKDGRLILTTVNRTVRNSDKTEYHLEGAAYTKLDDLFVYSRQGLKDARSHLFEDAQEQIRVHKAAIERLEKIVQGSVTLRIYNPSPTEGNYYVVAEDGKLTATVTPGGAE